MLDSPVHLQPRRGGIRQPKAPPWVNVQNPIPSPEGAAQPSAPIGSDRVVCSRILFRPFRASVCVAGYPRALPWAVVVPPRWGSEPKAIAAYLDLETAKLDALMAKVEDAIERLQEYRTVLITATVTGKIDVRKEES